MTRIGPHRLVVPALLALLIACTNALAQSTAAYAPGQVIVKYRPGLDAAKRASVLAALPAGRVLEPLSLVGADLVAVEGTSVEDAVARLSADPRVAFAEPNWIVTADLVPNDPSFGQLWNLHNTGQGGAYAGDDIDAVRAWDFTTGDPNLKIAVLDSGVDDTHPDLAGNMWINPGEIADNFVDDDGNGYVDDVHGFDVLNGDGDPMDDFGHGTHVAGIIGAEGNDGAGIVGVAWHCAIVAIKFIGSTGTGTEADAILGLQYALAVGAHVVNNSWGNMPGGQALRDAIDACGAAGVLLVFSAGNNGWYLDTVPVYPPSFLAPNMINVAATDGRDLRPTWSNIGPHTVHLGAPGVSVYSCKPGATYQTLNGTSMAAPHVSGAAALVMGRFPHASMEQVRQLILDHTDPVASMATTTITGGRLNVYNALAAGDATPPSAVGDLVLVSADTASLVVAWTAPGDDGAVGTASTYELRLSASPMDSASFATATLVPTSAPGPFGTPQQATITGLAPGATYGIALRASDDFGNTSSLSNVLLAATTLPGAGVDGAPRRGEGLRLASANPGVRSMRFTLELDAAVHVDAEVLDLGGRRVATLARGAMTAGAHPLAWNGRDVGGTVAAPGVYFARVLTPHAAFVRRFAIVR